MRMRSVQTLGLTCLVIGAAGLGPVSTGSAATVSIEKNANGSYDVVLTLGADDKAVYATDVFLVRLGGAVVGGVDKTGNPFDVAIANLKPAGKPEAILIGGSNIQGSCEAAPAQRCFDDASCGASGPCVMGHKGPELRLGGLKWDGKGALALDASSTAVSLNAGKQGELPLAGTGGCTSPAGLTVLTGADADGDGTIDACEPQKPAATPTP